MTSPANASEPQQYTQTTIGNKRQSSLLNYFSESKLKPTIQTTETSNSNNNVMCKCTPPVVTTVSERSKPVSAVQPTIRASSSLGNTDTNKSTETLDNCTNEGFQDNSTTPHPLATTKEKYLWGLLKGKQYSRQNVIVEEVSGRGRSAFAAKTFKAGDFVCEYGGVVRKKHGEDWGDQRNASLDIGCYCLDATYDNVTYVFDAAASINDPGRYINHARRNYNLVKMSPVLIGEPPRAELKIGFVAKKDISYGEELFFDYGLKSHPDFEWIGTAAAKIATTLQKVYSTRARSQSPAKKKKKRPPPNRTIMSCRVPGCTTRNVSKLADHLMKLHSNLTTEERHHYLKLGRQHGHRPPGVKIQQAIRRARTPMMPGTLTQTTLPSICSSNMPAGSMTMAVQASPPQLLQSNNTTQSASFSTVPKVPQPNNTTQLVVQCAGVSTVPQVPRPNNMTQIVKQTTGLSTAPQVPQSNSVGIIESMATAAPVPAFQRSMESNSMDQPATPCTMTATHSKSSNDYNLPKEFDYEGFQTYLKVSYSKNPTTAKSITRDVNLYLGRAEGSNCDILKLLNITELERFMEIMKDPKQLKFKPSTRKEKLNRIKLAIKFAKRSIDDAQLYYKANRVIDSIEEWVHGLNKDVSLQKQERGLVVREILPHLQDPNEFLNDQEVKAKLSKAFENASSGHCNKEEIDTITAYAAAATIYGNGQRSGAISNLTVAEFEMREESYSEESGDMVVIPCVHHKTGSQGLAYLVISEEVDDMIQYYHDNIRQMITPAANCEHYLFLTRSGEQYDQVYRRIKNTLGTKSMTPPQPGLYRVLISSEARRHLDEMKRRKTVKHLSHSAQTSETYYEYMNNVDATEAHANIRTLSALRRWKQHEAKLLTSRWPLSGDPPAIKDIRNFIKENHITRTSKEILAKWQQLHNSEYI
ncbi:uncharacterized protein [Dysidea avara]